MKYGGRRNPRPRASRLRRGQRLLRALALSALLILVPSLTLAQEWEPIGEGISYREFTDIPLQRIYVARMERDNPAVTLETSLGNRQLYSGKDTVSQMADRYDGTLSSWEPTWGGRMDVRVAVNGSFHDIESGRPHSGMVQSGWYIKKFNDLEGGSGFGWTLDRTPIIGGCVDHKPAEQLVTSLRTGNSRQLALVNDEDGNGLRVYTHQFGRRTPSRGPMNILVQMETPLTILPYPDMVHGVVKEVRGGGRIGIPFDHVVLSPSRPHAEWARDNLKVGDRVGFSVSVNHFRDDCNTPHAASWDETYSALSGSFEFLEDGEIDPHDHDLGAINPAPRTAICYDRDYLFFVVVDGRAEGRRGMTMQELGEFCRDTLGTDWGLNLDGGGSSTMWVDGEVVNRPSDGSERAVANGIMMVEIEPMERSTEYLPGDRVRATDLVDLSMGPGNLYQTPYDVREGDEGTIRAHEHGLEGVLATGDHWWQVDFGDDTGWVREEDLELIQRPEIPPTPTSDAADNDVGGPLSGRPGWWHRISSLFVLRWPIW